MPKDTGDGPVSPASDQNAAALLSFLKTVTRVLNKGTEQNASLYAAIKEIATFVGWPVGHIYVVNETRDLLEPTDVWFTADSCAFETFKEATAQTPFAFGVGMPGRVWETAQPEWMANVTPGPEFPRAQTAFDIGLISGFGFPLTAGETVMGVAEFFTTDDQPPDPDFLDCLAVIGSRLGRMVQLYRSQNMVARQAKVMNHVQEIIAITDSDGLILDCNDSFQSALGVPKERILGHLAGDFLAAGGEKEDIRARFFDSLKTTGVWHEEVPVVVAGGHRRIYDVSAVLYTDPVTQQDGTIISGHDVTARKQAEEALRENENRLARAIETHDAGIFERDFTIDTTYMSDSMKAITGYGDALTDDRQKWLDLVLPEDKHLSREAFAALRDGKKDQFDIEYRIKTKSGAIRWIRSRASAVKNEAGETVRAIGMLQDVTADKTSADLLKRQATVLQTMGDAVTVTDEHGVLIDCNPAYEAMMGFARDEIIGRKPSDFHVVTESGQDPTEDIRQAIRHGKTWQGQAIIRRKNGDIIIVESHATAIRNDKNDFVSGVTVSRDVTSRRKMEDSLARQAAALNNIKEAMLIQSAEGLVVDCNEGAQDLYGYTKDELIGMDSRKLVSPDIDADTLFERVIPEIMSEGHWSGELEIRRKDGTLRQIEISSTLLRDRKGEIKGWVELNRDITERKALEKELRRQAIIMERMNDGVAIADLNGNILDCNTGYARLLGYDNKNEIVGQSSRQYWLDWQDDPKMLDKLVSTVTAGKTWTSENRMRRRNGKELFVDTSITPLIQSDGIVEASIVVCRDITERKQIENARRLHFLVMEQLEEAVLITDLDGVIIECNATTENILGFNRVDLVGQPAISLLATGNPTERQAWRDEMLSELKTNHSVQVEQTVRRKDGAVRDVQITYGSLADEAGEEFARVVVAKDITDAKQTAQDLEISRIRVEAVIEASRAGIWEMDIVEGRTYIGPALKTLSGYGDSFADDIGQWRKLVHPDDLHIYDSRFEDWDGKKKKVDAEYRIINKGGEIKWVRSRGEMFGNEKGEMVRGIGLGWDITEERQKELRQEELEQRLLQSQKMETLGTLTGGIAHDFNNILTPILGYAHLAKADCGDQEDLQSHLQRIISGADRAKELVRRILTFSRQIEPARAEVDIQAIAREVFSLIAASAPPLVDITVTSDGKDARALADSTQVHQALMNLCTNSIQAIGEGPGTVSLDVSVKWISAKEKPSAGFGLTEGKYVCVNIRDTGPGIDPGIRDRIFEPFFTTRDLDEGTGLGLSVVHGIVEAHGGTIKLNETITDGTQFDIYLPALWSDDRSASDIPDVSTRTPHA